MSFITRKCARSIVVAVGALSAIPYASATQVLVNGNFETGTLAGWSATSTQNTSFQASLNDGQNSQVVNGGGSGGPVWYVRNRSANYFGTPATPIAGYSAFNGFDGDPGVFTLRQAFSVSGPVASSILNFSFAAQATYSNLARTFDANILDSTGATVLFNAFHFVLPYSNTSWVINNESLDISTALNSLGAGSYMLAFQENIPQSYTGPAQFAIDNISLDIANRATVPEPGSIALLGLALGGLAVSRRKRVASL